MMHIRLETNPISAVSQCGSRGLVLIISFKKLTENVIWTLLEEVIAIERSKSDRWKHLTLDPLITEEASFSLLDFMGHLYKFRCRWKTDQL